MNSHDSQLALLYPCPVALRKEDNKMEWDEMEWGRISEPSHCLDVKVAAGGTQQGLFSGGGPGAQEIEPDTIRRNLKPT